MYVKEKIKNIDYEALNRLYKKPINFIERISKVIHICLRKSEIGLGFTLGTEATVDKDESYTFVRNILDFSPAKYDGRLQVGDRILKINDVDVGSMFQTDIVRLIRSLPIGDIVTITVSRTILPGEDSNNVISLSPSTNFIVQSKLGDSNESKMEIFHLIITISNDIDKISHCHAATGVLGISVECRSTDSNDVRCNQAKLKKSRGVQKLFFVKTILKRGSAYQDGRLKVGDEILAVQGIDVQNGRTYIIDSNIEICGDIFHFDLATVFLKNLKKINKLSEFREIFENNSENTLHALKSLIQRAGDMYSSISIVIRRSVPNTTDKKWPDKELIDQTYKSCKKKLNDLFRIENIFELNPDYRHQYSHFNNRYAHSRYKEEQFNDIHGRSHQQRYIRYTTNSNTFTDESSLERCHVDNEDYECEKSMIESNNSDQSELYSYFSKDDPYADSDQNNNDLLDTNDRYCDDPFEVSGLDVVDFIHDQE